MAATFNSTPIGFADGTNADGTTKFLDGRQIFEDWMYADYLHDSEKRRLRIEPFRFDGSQEHTFLAILWMLAVNYVVFSKFFVEPLID